MRRALLLAVLAAPAVAAAQTVASGTIQFSDGPDDLVHGPFISAAECASTTAEVNLSWNTLLNSGATFPASAKYTVYASNKQHKAPNCTTTNNGTDTFAGAIGPTITATAQTQNLEPFSTATIVQVANLTCDTLADTPIYVCAQAYQSDGTTVVGYALGTMTLSTSVPGAPTGVTAIPADDGALQISWAAPTSSTTAYDYVLTVAAVTPSDDPNPHGATDIRALSYLMKGLVNGVPYTISVYARSQAGNQSLTAGTTTATPVPVANFWDVYHGIYKGQEHGGCSTGTAGPVALLAAAALLAKLRRRA